jgi:retron-type reverse transcriptase
MTKSAAEVAFSAKLIDQSTLFDHLFSAAELEMTCFSRFANSTGKGVDRVNGFQFKARAPQEFEVASAKCRKGKYRFAPYLESLKLKGRNKSPRIIGIPTVRDRTVLKQLNAFLAAVFPDRVPRNIANGYVRTVTTELKAVADTTWICSTDIKTFYDSIQRDRLLKVLAKAITCAEALCMIRHALWTPTVPKNTHRSKHADYQLKVGIPQGLAISNILASIYLKDVDEPMRKSGVTYFRYVDDVLMYGAEPQVIKAFRSLQARLRARGLALHSTSSGKSQIKPLSHRFDYLGYRIEWPAVTVRDSTIERFLHSIASKFSDYLHNSARRLERRKYLTRERLRDIFLLELNERITGAISESRKYGWIAYFSEITDMTLLHKLDATISAMFGRLDDFERKAPIGLRRLARAYYEIKFSPSGGYVRDYDKIQTSMEKLKCLLERGRVAEKDMLTDAQIGDMYAKYLYHSLAAMHSDEGLTYS